MNEMLEYLFFTSRIADKFIQALQERQLAYVQEIESVHGGIVLKIAEGVDDDLWDELDDLYDELSSEDQALLEEGMEDVHAKSTAGIYLQLLGGKQTIAQVDPDVMNRMLSVISMDEFNAFVETIVRSVETPDDSPICKH
ncbi:MAG TPA: hypothetical protein PLE99_07480 [Candidatus Thiothrix moscowensis]|uniref:hypothetical protein n=1 Tax=unclassified Thiothrix TaxID=2636184 RepID=UPI0025DA99C8|nr:MULTISPECIES: hypothetical protein [unclassified Thiothrix]HRJ52591.1 hypothetical protein [Candidatus Thiothrix moscowensis]HRJ94265.1 hypothetical protein [Candidatus Thiothrix moscowensis]